MIPRPIRSLGLALVRVWGWLVALATSRGTSRPTREMRTPLPEKLVRTARRTRELLFERADTVPAGRRADLVPVPVELADPSPPAPPKPMETRSEGELAIVRFHQIRDVLSPHPDRRTHVECECGWKCDAGTREIAWQEYDEHVKDASATFHRFEQLKRMARTQGPMA